MGRIAIAFVVGFAFAHAIAYLHVHAVLGSLYSSIGAKPILELPPTMWYLALSLLSAAVAAWAFVTVVRRRIERPHSVAAVVGALIGGALTSAVGVGLTRPIPPLAHGALQLVADIAIGAILGAAFGCLVKWVIARSERNAS